MKTAILAPISNLTCKFYRRKESSSEKHGRQVPRQQKEPLSSFKFKGTWLVSVGSGTVKVRLSSDALSTPCATLNRPLDIPNPWLPRA